MTYKKELLFRSQLLNFTSEHSRTWGIRALSQGCSFSKARFYTHSFFHLFVITIREKASFRASSFLHVT